MNKLEQLVEDYINGNITTAKQAAKRYAHWKLREAFMDAGYSENKATLTADHLKGRDCWQSACDAE